MNTILKNKGSIAIWIPIGLLIAIVGSYFLFSRSSQIQEGLPTTPPTTNESATTTTTTTVTTVTTTNNTAPLPVTPPKSKPLAKCDYAGPPPGCRYIQGPNYDSATGCGSVLSCPTPVVPTAPQSAAINWSGTWQGTVSIIAPEKCKGGPGIVTAYLNVINNKISGTLGVVGNNMSSLPGPVDGSVDGNNFSFVIHDQTDTVTFLGTLSGDTFSVKAINSYNCGNPVATEKPLQLFRLNYSGNWQGSFTLDSGYHGCYGDGTWNSNLNIENGKVSGNLSFADTTSGPVSGTLNENRLQFSVGDPGQAPKLTVDGTVSPDMKFVGAFTGTQSCKAGSSAMSGQIIGEKK